MSFNQNGTTSDSGAAAHHHRWANFVHSMRRFLCRGIQAWSRNAASYPWTTVVVSIVLALGLMGIGLATNFRTLIDGNQLYPPDGAVSGVQRKWIFEESGFPRDPNYFFLIIHATGANLLDDAQQAANKTFQALDFIRSWPGYDEACQISQVQDTCPVHGIINFWEESSEVFYQQVRSDEDAVRMLSRDRFSDSSPVDENRVFGNFERDTDSNRLITAQAFLVQIDFPSTKRSNEFELKILRELQELRRDWQNDPANIFRLEFEGSESINEEANAVVEADVPLMPIAFLLMSIFNVIVYSNPRDKRCVQSQSLLGIAAVVAVILALSASYGFMFILGVPLVPGAQLIVFVMFGIGVDDSFIITGSYKRSDPNKDPVERIHETMEDIGVSIGLTTLTSFLAFAFGCISSVPFIYLLCYYAMPTILVVFFYQTSFFVACTVIDERRIQQNRRDCLVCLSARIPDEPTEQHEEGENEEQEDDPNLQVNAECTQEIYPSTPAAAMNNKKNQNHGFMTDQVMKWYAQNLMRPWIKTAVIVAFILLFACSVYGSTKLEQKMAYRDIVAEDSYVVGYLDAREQYASNTGNLGGFIFFRNVDQADSNIHNQMKHYVQDLASSEAIAGRPEYFWLDHFYMFQEQAEQYDEAAEAWISNATFTEKLDAFLRIPSFAELYSEHIVRDPNTGEITASRCFMYIKSDLQDTREMIDHLTLFREQEALQPVNNAERVTPENAKEMPFFSYSRIFFSQWEFYVVLKDELIITTIAGVLAVSLVALLLIPHLTAVVFVFVAMATLYIDLLVPFPAGFFKATGVAVNPISYLVLVMSIGLMVDYILHIFIRYYEMKGTRNERVVESLSSMGSSILLGGFSTLLGVVMLAFSVSFSFQIVFRAFAGMVILGCSYGLVLVPVVLSLVGPEDSQERQGLTDVTMGEASLLVREEERGEHAPESFDAITEVSC